MADWMWLTGITGLVMFVVGLIGIIARRPVETDVEDYTEEPAPEPAKQREMDPELLSRMFEVNPLLAAEVVRGQERRERDFELDRAEREYHRKRGVFALESPTEFEPLHAHEVTANDAALMRMLRGATFGPDAKVQLPSGKWVTGDEMARWVEDGES